jgi:hypothetical protein
MCLTLLGKVKKTKQDQSFMLGALGLVWDAEALCRRAARSYRWP